MKIRFMILLFLIVILCSCNQNIKENTDTNYYQMRNITHSDKGIYYVELDMNHDPWINTMYFIDPTSNKKTILCNKINCQHNKEDCDGVFIGDSFIQLHYYQSYLYITSFTFSEEGDYLTLYRCNENGSGIKKLHTFPDINMIPDTIVFNDYKIFISVQSFIMSEDGLSSYGSEPCIYMYDLIDNKQTLLVDGVNNPDIYSRLIGGYSNKLVIAEYDEQSSEHIVDLYTLDYVTNEKTVLFSTSLANMQFINEPKFYEVDLNENKIEVIDLIELKKNVFLTYKNPIMDEDDQLLVGLYADYVEFNKWNVENNTMINTEIQIYDYEQQNYIFDDYMDVYVLYKYDNYYLIEKQEQLYFFDYMKKNWITIDDVNQ